MDLSFVILTWNSDGHIQKCINSIHSSLSDSDYTYEIFVVDNGSTDNTVRFLNESSKKHGNIIKPILLDSNTGTTYPRNLAIKKATGEYLVVLDSDVIVGNGSIDLLILQIGSDKSIGMAVPKLVYGSGTLQKSTDVFPTVWRKLYRYFFLKYIENSEASTETNGAIRNVDYAISAFWLIKREVVQEVGLLDENIFYAPEDVDYCLRIWKKGYKIVYVPGACSIHNAQEISRGFKLNKAMIEHVKGLLYFFNKHKYIFRKPRFE